MKPFQLDCTAYTTPLRGLLSLLPSCDNASQREISSYSVVINLQHVAISSIQQTLQSVAVVESYSHSLQQSPLVKQAFWEQVLTSDLMVDSFATIKKQLQLQDKRFPRLVLDFSRRKITEELLETLVNFMKTQRRQATSTQPHIFKKKREVPLTLTFVRCRLTSKLIDKLTTLLLLKTYQEEHKAHITYCVTTLDLSENAMMCNELKALTQLLNACGDQSCRPWEMPLEELVLENALGRTLTTENWAAFRAFVGAAFGINAGILTPLKRLSLANNSLSHRHVSCICSALRFEDSRLEELSLAHTFSLVDPIDRKLCWQWLAIGLRSAIYQEKRSGLRRLDLSGNPLFPIESEAWLEGLRCPQSTVMGWVKDDIVQTLPYQDVASIRCLLASSTELFFSPSEDSLRLDSIENEIKALNIGAEPKEWEVLATSISSPVWLCILVPGFGVAWAKAKHAMSWVHTRKSLSRNSAILSELVMNDMVASMTTTEAIERFVRGFHGRLQSLELRRNALSAMDLDAIVASCPQLNTLDVEACKILQLQLLVDALSTNFGRNLHTLNLNANLIGTDSVNVLASALRAQGHENGLVLQELRVARNEIGANGVRHLHAALDFNKVLMVLELDVPNEGAEVSGQPNDDEYMQLYRTRCMQLGYSFQNELLGATPLSDDQKVSFLMVLHALHLVLDRGIGSAIFDFAASEKRRRILWNSAQV